MTWNLVGGLVMTIGGILILRAGRQGRRLPYRLPSGGSIPIHPKVSILLGILLLVGGVIFLLVTIFKG